MNESTLTEAARSLLFDLDNGDIQMSRIIDLGLMAAFDELHDNGLAEINPGRSGQLGSIVPGTDPSEY